MGTPRIHRITLEFERLPVELESFTIAHLSDLHCSSSIRRPQISRIVEMANSLKPDMVAITGDFVDGLPSIRGNDLEPLSQLRAPHGVWGCTGNHDFYWGWKGWRPLLKNWGVNVLENESRPLINGKLVVAGVNDPAVIKNRHGDLDSPAPDPRVALALAPTDVFRILLTHRPLDATMMAENQIDLQLCGHTHGGAMPILHWLVAAMNDGYVRGIYQMGQSSWLHVSPGTGQWAGFPLRFFNPVEITLITLKRRCDK